MKKIILGCFGLVLAITCFSQQNAARLIVRGDDMGFTHAGNEAIIACYKLGIETTAEIIPVSPWFPEAVKLLMENPGLDVGVHLCLSSEWEGMKWRPLTCCPSLIDENGYFFPWIFPDATMPGKSIVESQWKLDEIEKEFRAQIELTQRNIPLLSHYSAHMGCTDMDASVQTLIKKLAVEYKIDIDLDDYKVISSGYQGPSKNTKSKIKGFLKMLYSLEVGKIYMFVDHPAYDTNEMKGISPEVSKDRQGVTDLFTNKKVKSAIKKHGIELISYRDLKIQQ